LALTGTAPEVEPDYLLDLLTIRSGSAAGRSILLT
jgi:hypothetical protein